MPRTNQQRWVSIVTAATVLAAGVLTATAVPASAAPKPAAPAEQPDEASAGRAAAKAGKRVEVAGRRTETARTFANPNGTLTVEQAPFPVRVKRPDGGWVPVDLTLRRAADGTVSPVAGPVDVRLSGGGDAALAAVTHGGESLAVSWPKTLPAPVLAGDTATYPEVLSGVDLRVRATRDGFSEVLVVKTPQAAANPELARIALTTKSTSAVRAADGSTANVEHAGKPVLRLDAPLMWDSTAPVRAAAADPRTGESPDSTADGPGGAARRAPVGLSVAGDQLVITPDRGLLGAPDVRYPLFIDPSASVGAAWTMINSTFPDQSYWSYDRNEHAKVGFINDPRNMVYRSIFQFGTDPWRNRHVLGATFSADLLHSYSCSNSITTLHLTGGVNAGTTWNNNAGSWGGQLASVSNSSCNDARKYTEWGGLAGIVAQSAGWSSITLGLKAGNEGGTSGWKKFDENSVRLSVTYNTAPNAPSELSIDNKPCATGDGRPVVSTVGGRQPVLRARITDPDGDNQLSASFSWTTRDGSTHSAGQGSIANGGYAQVALSPGDFASGVYSFRVNSGDGVDGSPVAGPCEFMVDSAAPDKGPKVTAPDGRYVADDGTQGWHDGVGKVGSFTFDPAGISDNGVNDIVGYRYGLVDPPATDLAAPRMGEAATISLTPTKPGITTLYVRSLDRAGNLSPITKYRFFVGSGAAPVGMWKLSDGTGTTATDTGSGQHPGAFAGGMGWSTDGRLVGSGAATFNGTDGTIAAGAPVIRTDQSFAVAAWVRPNATDSNFHTAVSIDGNHTSAFYLQYRKDTQKWSFTLAPQDTDDRATTIITAPAVVAPGAWYHLAAVYDAPAHKAKLYVGGKLVASADFTYNWTPGGSLMIGRGKFWSGPADWWAGDIAEVRAWDRVVYDDEVAALAAPVIVGAWDLDEHTGTDAFDNTVFAHNGTLTGGARFTDAGHRADDTGAVTFNATDASVATNAPAIRTDQSFTVSGWVRLTDNTTFRTAISQDGVHSSAFYLQYRKDNGKWALTMRNVDSDSGGSTVIQSQQPAALNQWTHLVGVYDAQSRTAKLYVNGALQATKAFTTPWHAGGALVLGRGRTWSGNTDWWAGDLDDLRVYQGALSDADIATLTNS